MAFYGRPSLNRGDYYRGDYYRGDPNIFGSLFGGLKSLARQAVGMIPGVGPFFDAGLRAREALAKHGVNLPVAGGPPGAAEAVRLLTSRNPNNLPGFSGGPTMPGGSIPIPVGPPSSMALTVPGGHGLRRMHPNRSTYVTRGGGTSRWPAQLIVHPKGTEAVPSRRMNVGNARALRRSIRRLHGFAKLARRVLAVTRHFKKRGRARARR